MNEKIVEDFKQNHIKDSGFIDKKSLLYVKLSGFNHIWDYFKTEKGNFICSKYFKEKGNRLTSIRNSPEGWVVHLFIGSSNEFLY